MSTQPPPRRTKEPSYLDVFIPLAVLIGGIGGAVSLFGLTAIDGPVQVALMLSTMTAALVILKNGHPWDEIAASGGRAISSIVSAIFILLAVGGLIGTWNMSGTIPTMVYYGIQLLQPGWFYIASAIICALVALSIGSSWTTVGTIGVGLIGIASLLGVSPEITAGAVISGAYLGDKTSPLSETSILSAQLVGVDIYTHIRAQVWTSIPSFIVALIVFVILGLKADVVTTVETATDLAKLNQLFWITPLNLIPLVFLAFLSFRKVPASLAIMSAALVGGIMGTILQPQAILRFINDPAIGAPLGYIKGIWLALANGYQENSGISEIDQLLSRGGMDSMLLTLWIIIGAVTFGTLMEEFGLLAKLINPVLLRARTVGSLFFTVMATAIGLNIVAGDQYIALVLPARLFRIEFQKRGLKPQNLSRIAADCGTVTSPLVPWNSCGAFMAATLGIPTALYFPYAIFNIVSPILSVLYGITGFKVERVPPVANHSELGR
ncbi:Na+/H+ antiporter NhaC (plasmid) [Kovacikia minuta CCNUW1]|uniref:Na+/H+ antiporter NhaC family protein n=1 Tax=Kovacikia minuta TaxID=2931930 RepID=UPI001CC91AF6|nr:Na+/H+ antiporter NhaC family protein [Kovacikia minuta]UBF30466.1 Na+/H+ antiporter NhaC [Kovacikia minuta CCNUW1]